ncbi:isopenicillin N synthase family dioxygenase [Trujillonella endophytica]|uniref:Isopenicillin N synthase n=1 Tax=Trujillonella endophytica TaxID=673521 RepID=A0A1H8UBQ6_9ACTN|nr:2-oxoglutarate and iron-dependent oxygenase domain-containing protein [Trujillella endophytica]SEP00625.1 Isopenicillin N synthase [Trujillella endophytica]
MPEQTVPLVDLTDWYTGDRGARRRIAGEVDRALADIGFLLVTGHRLSPGLLDGVRAEARRFFALPAEAKAGYACRVGGRGWIPPGAESNGASEGLETAPDLKESWTFGQDALPDRLAGTGEEGWYAPSVWPAEVPGLQAAGRAFGAAADALADTLLAVFAEALALPPDFFTSRCTQAPWTVNLNWYPPRAALAGVADDQFRIGPHSDFGTLTLLDREPGAGGLQVCTPDGEWVDAPFVPGALTVNTGDLLARWTGDRWRSTMHRVLPPPAAVPTEELLSLVFFHEAEPDVVVETLPTAAAGPTGYEPVTAGGFLRSRLASISVA